MSRRVALVILASSAFLGACTFNPIDNQQVVSGITTAQAEWGENGPGGLKSIRIRDGKEAGAVSVRIAFSNGAEMTYNANDLRAFRGQELRAAVEQSLAEAQVAVTPAIVDGVVKAILGL